MTRRFLGNLAVEGLSRIANKVLVRRQQRYDQYRSNPPNEGQHYTFAGALVTQPVRVDGSLAVPEGEGVFLCLDLRVSGWGHVRDPYVELTTDDGQCVRQYLERGLNAKRYVNATPLAGRRVNVALSDLVLNSVEAAWLISPHQALEAPLLVLAPHPDDAELASFGLYSSRPSWAVTVSAGEVGTHDYGGLFSHDEAGALLRGQTRVVESLSAPLVGGVPPERCANLGYFDGTLSQMRGDCARAGRSLVAGTDDLSSFRRVGRDLALPNRTQATWNDLVDDIACALHSSNAATVAFPHPLLDEHRDHACTGLATLQALQRVDRPITALTYVVHGPGGANGANIHPVGSRDGIVGLQPGWHEEPLFDGIVSFTLSEEQLRRKAIALDTYRDLKDPSGPLPVADPWFQARRGLRDVYRAWMVYDVGLMRRFARPTEIFYRLDSKRLADWQRIFEAKLSKRIC